MVIEETSNILSELSPYSVIIQGANCKGAMPIGIASQINRKFEGWYDSFHEYCSWFNKSPWCNHDCFDMILGSFHRFQPESNDKVIICSAFVDEQPPRNKYAINLELWEQVLRKIERQTRRVHKLTGKPWTLHITHSQCFQESVTGDLLMDVIKEIFDDSPVKIYVHNNQA